MFIHLIEKIENNLLSIREDTDDSKTYVRLQIPECEVYPKVDATQDIKTDNFNEKNNEVIHPQIIEEKSGDGIFFIG